MKQIPLKAIERQSLSVMLEGELYDITLKECNGSMAMAIKRGELTILDFRRVCAGIPVIPRGHSDMGNFIFTSFKDEFPYFNRFESSDQLFYVTMEELATIDPDKLIELATPLSTPLVKFDASLAISLPNYLTLNRDSPLHYVNRDGVVTTAEIDQPGFETDGLVMESSSTNIVLTSSYSVGNITRTARTNINSPSPDGGTTAVMLSNTAEEGGHYIYPGYIDVPANSSCSFTTYVKAGTILFVTLALTSSLGGYYRVGLDLTTGETVSTASLATNTNFEAIQIMDGWWKITMSGTLPNTNISGIVYLAKQLEANVSSYVGDPAEHIFVWQEQLELTGYPTSLIKTSGAAAAREPARLDYTMTDAEWMYRKFKPYNGAEVKELVRYSGDILPSNFYGHLKELILWNREPTAREKAELGV